jgi:hypothetical protein
MDDFDIEMGAIDTFMKELDDLQKHFPREAKRLMLRSGTKARAIVLKKAKQLVKKRTGNYFRSIKRGKVWVDGSTHEYKVRVYSRSPHAHLLEYGHRIVDKNGVERGFKEGYHVYQKATREIDDQWTEIVAKEFDKMMSKL